MCLPCSERGKHPTSLQPALPSNLRASFDLATNHRETLLHSETAHSLCVCVKMSSLPRCGQNLTSPSYAPRQRTPPMDVSNRKGSQVITKREADRRLPLHQLFLCPSNGHVRRSIEAGIPHQHPSTDAREENENTVQAISTCPLPPAP